MSLYSDVKEIYNDLKSDKFMRIIARILGVLVTIFAAIILFKSLTEPVTILGIELNKDKIKHDTTIRVIHDTLYYVTHQNPPQVKAKNENVINGKTDVKSINQKGGQTANQINNNN